MQGGIAGFREGAYSTSSFELQQASRQVVSGNLYKLTLKLSGSPECLEVAISNQPWIEPKYRVLDEMSQVLDSC